MAAPDPEPVSPTDDSASTPISRWEGGDNDDEAYEDSGTPAKEGPPLPANILEGTESPHNPSSRDESTGVSES